MGNNNTQMVRVQKNLIQSIRLEFPSLTNDNNRIASLFDQHRRLQGAVNGVGGFLYGSKTWKKITQKR